MTIQQLASMVAKLEGKKSNARVGDVREILGILADLMQASDEPLKALQASGAKRAKRRTRK